MGKMYKYRCKCRFNLLIFICNELLEIRPNQIIELSEEVNNHYLELITDELLQKNNGSPKRSK